MRIAIRVHFDAAHKLDWHPGKCRRLHGHTYEVEVVLFGPVRQPEGVLIDFSEMRKHVKKVIDELDHRYLNEIIENPTVENITLWLYKKLKEDFLEFEVGVRVWEGKSGYAEINLRR